MISQKILIYIVLVIALTIVGFSIYKPLQKTPDDQASISNFEDCAKAGYPVMESYPRQCRVPGGELFVETIANPNPSDRIAAGYVGGHATIGPNCPVEIAGQPCQTPPEAYTSRKVVVYENDRTTVKEKSNLDSKGDYKIALSPGNYFIQIVPAGIGPGEKKPATVKSFETTIVNFDIDTGIR